MPLPKLSRAQATTLKSLQDHITETPDNLTHGPFSPPYDYKSDATGYIWYEKYIYCRKNSATLKALEKKGYLKLIFDGKANGTDIIQLLTHKQNTTGNTQQAANIREATTQRT